MARDPKSRNPRQQSIYVWPDEWEAVGEIARRKRTTRSAFIRGLIRLAREEILGKKWKPEARP